MLFLHLCLLAFLSVATRHVVLSPFPPPAQRCPNTSAVIILLIELSPSIVRPCGYIYLLLACEQIRGFSVDRNPINRVFGNARIVMVVD